MRGLPETRAQARQAPWIACAGREVALFCLVRPLSVCADLTRDSLIGFLRSSILVLHIPYRSPTNAVRARTGALSLGLHAKAALVWGDGSRLFGSGEFSLLCNCIK